MATQHRQRVGTRHATTARAGLLLAAGAFRRRVDRAVPDRLSTPLDEAPLQDPVPNNVWAWSVNAAGIFTASNCASTEMVGYRPADLIGQNVALVLDAPELRRAYAVTEALGGGGTSWRGIFVEARHRNGTMVWLKTTARPRYATNGDVVGCDGTTRMVGPDADSIAEQHRITERIRSVLTDRSVRTAFQPIVGLAAGSVIGVEALSRFSTDPARVPDEWFAQAASVGLGTRLELLAIEMALTVGRALPEHLYISVNASPTTCLDPRLIDVIALSAAGPGRVVLELTEHDAVADYGQLERALNNLRRMGVRLAVDDAGSGFASFQHILRLRPDFIKLDRSIVANIDGSPAGRALCAAVIAFAARIGAQVIAEGIETHAELIAVTELGMKAGQGFYLGRPSLLPTEWVRWHSAVKATQQVQLAISVLNRGPALDVGSSTPARTTDPVVPTGAWGAAAGTAPQDAGPTAAAFAALPDATAVLDRNGRITSVNRAWQVFAADNGGTSDSTSVGVGYLDVCVRAAESGSADAAAVVAGLRAVLSGAVKESNREYPCDSPSVSRWFVSRITAIDSPSGGAVVSHVNVTRRRRAELENQQQALHDPLTGVANRMLLTKRLAAALDRRSGCDLRPDVGVIFIDIAALTEVNNTYGHAAADELLMVTANRILVQLNQRDTLARLGAGRFAVCVTRTNPAHLDRLANGIALALARTHTIHGHQVVSGASIGTYLAGPQDTASPSLQAAEQAMYAVRHARPRAITA
jgi:diguanylate cyclase (GGDEF)-like protein/PAS domain S-box-containing protein